MTRKKMLKYIYKYIYILGDLQDGRGVRHGDHLPPRKIHQKYIYMWNNTYRTPTESWQETSDFQKGKKLPTYLAMCLTGSCCSGRVSGLCL